jgi:hypothetical protein
VQTFVARQSQVLRKILVPEESRRLFQNAAQRVEVVGVCDEVDLINQGTLRPRGAQRDISIRRDGQIRRRDSQFNRYPSENNAVRAHQIESGMYDGCFISFTRSEESARRFAIRNADGERTSGYIYVVDEDLLAEYEVVAHELSDPLYPTEMEVTLRANDNGDLPSEIVVRKVRVYAEDV